MIQLEAKPGRSTLVQGEEYLFFTGFSYLGLSTLPAFSELLIEGIRRYGSVHPSSRVSNTQQPLLDAFEQELSRHIGLADTVSFSSGYMASQAAIHALRNEGEILFAPGAHPALCTDGAVLPAEDWQSWTAKVSHFINDKPTHRYVIAADAVNALTGLLNDFSWLQQMTTDVIVLIDDSHGMGILGDNGEGIVSLLPKADNLRYVISYSLAKAMGIQGGAVSGDKMLIDCIRSQPFYGASTGIMPANAYAYMQGNALYKTQYQKLKENISIFNDLIAGNALLSGDEKLPVYFTKKAVLYDYCLERKMILSSFAYPGKDDPKVTRIVLNSLHTEADLRKLASAVLEFESISGS